MPKICEFIKFRNYERAKIVTVHNLIEDSKYCSEVIKKHFNKELVMTKYDNEDFKKFTQC